MDERTLANERTNAGERTNERTIERTNARWRRIERTMANERTNDDQSHYS